MLDVMEVYLPDRRGFELRPLQDRVLDLVRLFADAPTVRLLVCGTIAAGEPIEAFPEPEAVDVRGPTRAARRYRNLRGLREHLCPALDQASSDAFEIARIVTPLLASLRLSGTLDIDLDPWLFAGISLLIARMGVAAFCDEDEGDADEGRLVPGGPSAPVATPAAGGRHRRRHAPGPSGHMEDADTGGAGGVTPRDRAQDRPRRGHQAGGDGHGLRPPTRGSAP